MAGIGSRLDSQIHPAEKFGYIQPFSMEEQSFSAPERGGAAFSQIKRTEQEEELRTRTQERLTLDDVRWSDMRKKVPLMGRVPVSKINETADDESFQTLKFQHISYIRQNFKQLECQKFIPNPKELPGTDKVEHLKCYCGETLKSHVPYDITPQGRKNYGNLIPMELKPFIDIHDLSKKVPDKLPTLKWTKEEALKEKYTTSFGKVQFTGMEQVGGMKPAKYLRLKDEHHPDVVDYAINLMKVHWRIMEPRTPSLVISVVGGAKNFKLSGKMRETFQSGLIKASKTTNAWLITSGFNMGVMKEVGLAVREGQSFEWYKDRFAHVLRCIGIAPWGYVKNRDVMTDHNVSYILGKFDKIAEYKTSNVIEHRKPVPLNSDHTHFIFVDDGFRNSYQGAAEFRARFEKKLSDPVSKGGEGIPVVLIVVEGGRDAIEDAKTSLDQNIPVILCEGTGRAADILVYAYNNPERRSKIVNMIKKAYFEVKPEDKTKEAIVKKANSDAEKVYESVEKCIAKKYLISIFHINKHEELDNEILKILLKAKKGEATETQSLERLKLALKWDRADIAQEEIFREDALWSRGSLDDVLKDAMLSDNVKFVQIIMNQGVVMKDYLTLPRLMILYREALEIEDINNRPLKNVMTKLRIDKLNKDTLVVILKRLMDKFELDMEENVEDTEEEKPEENRFKYPYKHLLVWSLLLLRQNMANLALKMGGEPITSTVAASRIHYSLATFIHRNESSLKSRVQAYKVEFDDLATVILDECHERDPNKAMMLAERRSPMWSNMTSMEMAASADNQTFLASVACQNSIGTIWKRGVTSSWQKVFLVSMFPLLAFTPLLDVEKLGDRTISGWQKFLTFITSPIAKFTYHSLTYMAFLLLFTYFLLVEFRTAHVTPIEILCVIWIFTYIIDNIYTFLAFPSPTLKGTFRDWFGLLKGSDYANCILAVIAFFLHYGGTSYSRHAKAIYCVNVMVFYIRVMEIYTVNSRLGPKLVMIKRIMLELVIFILVLTVFLCAYGIARQGLLYLQRESEWVILKDVLYEPYWNFYGELNLDEIADDDSCQNNYSLAGLPDSTYCKSFHWLVPIILAAYLLIANVLLLNLLIAIFSNVFHEVEVNSNRIWKYQMYMLVMEYDTKAALVPPFSLIIHVYLVIKWIFRKTCCRKSKGRQYGSRHLEYLQLFEKEQLCNYLRKKKAEAKSDTDISILSMQKRIDELYKMIKEDFMDETDQPTVDRENSRVGHETLTATKTAESTSLAKAVESANEIQVADKEEEEKKEKKHKKKKKKKKLRENEEKVLNIDKDIKKPEAENDKMVPHFLEENQTPFSKISTPRSLQKKKSHQQRRHDRSLESDSDDDNRPRSVRMNIRQEFDNSDVNDFSSVRKNIRSLSRSHDSNTEEEREYRGSTVKQKPRSSSRPHDSNTEEEKEYRGSKIRQKIRKKRSHISDSDS